jgi:hypothetical protein
MIDELELVRRARPDADPANPQARRAALRSLEEAIAREGSTRHRRRPRRGWRLSQLAAGLAAAATVVVAAVFLSLHSAHPNATSHRPPPLPKRSAPASRAPQLVSMRRINGATYQTVVIRTDGTGDVGIFIGELAGSHHRQFRLASAQLTRLKHLVGTAARTRQTPNFGTQVPSVEYIVFTRQSVLELAKGHVPDNLSGLVDLLSGLIDRYA